MERWCQNYVLIFEREVLLSFHTVFHPNLPLPSLLTRKLQSEALFACEEVGSELQADGVKGAVGVRGQYGATQLPQ